MKWSIFKNRLRSYTDFRFWFWHYVGRIRHWMWACKAKRVMKRTDKILKKYEDSARM